MSNGYLRGMLARIVAMFAILAIAVVTTVTSAHAARMSMGAVPDHLAHVSEMMHAEDSKLACAGEQRCGSTSAEMCEFLCTGLSVFLTSPGGESSHECEAASHDLFSDSSHASCAPELNERPPKLRLL